MHTQKNRLQETQLSACWSLAFRRTSTRRVFCRASRQRLLDIMLRPTSPLERAAPAGAAPVPAAPPCPSAQCAPPPLPLALPRQAPAAGVDGARAPAAPQPPAGARRGAGARPPPARCRCHHRHAPVLVFPPRCRPAGFGGTTTVFSNLCRSLFLIAPHERRGLAWSGAGHASGGATCHGTSRRGVAQARVMHRRASANYRGVHTGSHIQERASTPSICAGFRGARCLNIRGILPCWCLNIRQVGV